MKLKMRRDVKASAGLLTTGRRGRRVKEEVMTSQKKRHLGTTVQPPLPARATPTPQAATAVPPAPTAGGSGSGNSRRRRRDDRTGSGERLGPVEGKRRRLSQDPQPSTSTAISAYGISPRISKRLSKLRDLKDRQQKHEDITEQHDEHAETERLENDVNELLCTFGDCDPDYIRDKMKSFMGDSKRYELTKKYLLQEKYPTLKDKLKQQYVTKQMDEGLAMSTEELIRKFVREEDVFLEESRKRKADGKQVYLKHAIAFLANCCRLLPIPHIQNVVRKQNDVIGAYTKLNEENERRLEAPKRMGRRGTYLRKPREQDVPAPTDSFSDFCWDSLYIENYAEIEAYKESQAASKTLRYMQAKTAGQLEECPVCLALVLQEDMLGCQVGHHACKDCVHQAVTEQVGLGTGAFPCLFPDCDEQLDLQVLFKALPWSLYQTVEKRVQEEQVRRANIPGLVSCPHCFFAVIFPEEGQRDVLQCENPDCLATTCRFCKSEAHVLINCEERAKKRLQLHIENKMSAAVIRRCPDCNMSFVKGGGCNRMECPRCWASICYACGEKLGTNGYAHFTTLDNNSRCKELDENKIHRKDIAKAIPEAKAEFRAANPVTDRVTIELNFLADWDNAPKMGKVPTNH